MNLLRTCAPFSELQSIISAMDKADAEKVFSELDRAENSLKS